MKIFWSVGSHFWAVETPNPFEPIENNFYAF